MAKNKKLLTIPTYRLEMVEDGCIHTHSTAKAADIIKTMKSFALSDRESLIGFYLNSWDQIIAHQVISVGTVNTAIVHPREVFKLAIIKNACSVIVAHNHPSGCELPSAADLKVTRRLIEAGKILGIELKDHIIITPNGRTYSVIKPK